MVHLLRLWRTPLAAVGIALIVGACGTAAPTPHVAPTGGSAPSASPGASIAAPAISASAASSAPSAGASASSGASVGPASSLPYTCLQLLTPAPSPAASTPVTGQPEDDMGALHVLVGTNVTYDVCPPASGKHFSSSGLGPIAPRFYGPDDVALPQGWIHNLEHGGMVILYNCAQGGCDPAVQSALRTLASTFPPSPRCGIPGGALSPVIARFDQMSTGFAGLVWNRVLLQPTLDIPQLLEFYKNVDEQTNPEQFC